MRIRIWDWSHIKNLLFFSTPAHGMKQTARKNDGGCNKIAAQIITIKKLNYCTIA